MYDLDAIAAAIVVNLAPLSDANGGLLGQIQPVAVNPTPPCAFVVDGDIDYDLALGRGADLLHFEIIVQVGLTTERGAQEKLRALRASDAVKQAVESDQTLGGLVDWARVTKAGTPEIYGRSDGTTALGCGYAVEVMASGA
jgi:hypothetical protein